MTRDSVVNILVDFTLAWFLIGQTGCGGEAKTASVPPPDPPSTPTPTPPASGSEFLYLFSDGRAPEVSTLNPSTGTLSSLTVATPYSPTSGDAPSIIPVATPSGKYVYASGYSQSNVSTPINAIFCYALTGTQGELTSVRCNPQNYVITTGPPGVGAGTGMIVNRQGTYDFFSCRNINFVNTGNTLSTYTDFTITTYTIDANTGTLLQGPAVTNTYAAWLIVAGIDPAGKYLYAWVNFSDRIAIAVYAINPATGALTEITGSPFTVAVYPGNIVLEPGPLVVSPSGSYIYASTSPYPSTPGSGSGVYAFSVDSTTGALNTLPGSPFPSGEETIGSLSLDPGGRFLYVSGFEGVSVFAVDSTNGSISTRPVSSVVNTTNLFDSSMLDPSGRVLIEPQLNALSTFTIDGSTGSLTPSTGAPISIPSGPFSYLFIKIP